MLATVLLRDDLDEMERGDNPTRRRGPPEMATITNFTGEQRDHVASATRLNDPDLRPRVLSSSQRSAASRPVPRSRSSPHSHAIGSIAGHRASSRSGTCSTTSRRPTSTVHRPRSGGARAMLDQPVRQLFADRAGLNRVVEAISKDQAVDYLAALTKLHEGVDEARGGTVRMALAAARLPTDGIEAGLRLLERRDEAADEAYWRALGPVEQTDERGLVLLDQGSVAVLRWTLGKRSRTRSRSNVASLGSAEHRLAGKATMAACGSSRPTAQTLRRAATSWRPRSAAGRIAAAGAKANQVARQLDQAIREETDQRQRMRVLDKEIAKLSGERDRLAPTADATASATERLRRSTPIPRTAVHRC